MKKDGYFSSGEFARMAHVTIRTIRYYDKKNLLKPSFTTESGARFYTVDDFRKLQQILLLKYLGFSLEDISEMIIEDSDSVIFQNALLLQKKLIQDRIEQMQMVADSIEQMVDKINNQDVLDWNQMLDIIHLTSMESSMKKQYINANNISARIRLHEEFSTNKQGWFPWILDKCNFSGEMKVLELGSGNGKLWTCVKDWKQEKYVNISVTVSDISEGMIRDARRNIGRESENFCYEVIDAMNIPYESESFDMVIANHTLFYCDDIDKACKEISRVIKNGGRFICSTYGAEHMREITDIVQEFDQRIVLSGEALYEKFGLENGESILGKYFDRVNKEIYDDSIIINKPEPLIEYILSCHGNQNQYLLEKYNEFKQFISKKTESEFYITKGAGVFICEKFTKSKKLKKSY